MELVAFSAMQTLRLNLSDFSDKSHDFELRMKPGSIHLFPTEIPINLLINWVFERFEIHCV